MKKILFAIFAVLFVTSTVFADSVAKNIHILIDTGKNMRDDGTVENIYKIVGSYVADFIKEHHNDEFGKDVNIIIDGVVSNPKEKKLQTIRYVTRKAGSPLDLTALGKDMETDPESWGVFTSATETNLDLFGTHFFENASDTVYVVITNSTVGRSTFFGRQSSEIIDPKPLDIHRSIFPNNVRVFMVNIPNAAGSGEMKFKSTIVKERIKLGMDAAWKAVRYKKPQASLVFNFKHKENQINSYIIDPQKPSQAPVANVYAPVTVELCAGNAIDVKQINVSGSDGIEAKEYLFQDGENSFVAAIASLNRQGTYQIKADVIGKNGESYSGSFRFNVYSSLVMDIAANNTTIEQSQQVVKGVAPLTVNFNANIANAQGRPQWFRNGKAFNPYTDNVFTSNADVECRVNGFDGKVYSQIIKIVVVEPEVKFSATANSVQLSSRKDDPKAKISGQRPVFVKFASKPAENVTWFRNNKKFTPADENIRFDNSEEVKCVFVRKGKTEELFVKIEVVIPKPVEPVLNVCANGVMLSDKKGEAKLEVEVGKTIKFDFLTKNNIASVKYFRDGLAFTPDEKIQNSCVIEVCGESSDNKTVRKFINVEVPVRIAKLVVKANGQDLKEKISTVNTDENGVEVTFSLDKQYQIEDLKNKYKISYEDNSSKNVVVEKTTLTNNEWKKTFAAGKSYQIKLYYEDKECDRFSLTVDRKYKFGFGVIVVEESKGPEVDEDGTKYLTLAEGQTVEFRVSGITPGENLADMRIIIDDGMEEPLINADLAELKKAIVEAEVAIAESGEAAAPAKPEDASVFTWRKNDFNPGSYTVRFVNTKTGFEDTLVVSVTGREIPPDPTWPKVLIGILIAVAVCGWFFFKRNVSICVSKDKNKGKSKKFANGVVKLNDKFADAPEITLEISNDKILVKWQGSTRVGYSIGGNTVMTTATNGGKIDFGKGTSKKVTLSVSQNSTQYTIMISK